MNVFAIIPARMGSSRFPGKPLTKICGIPMVGHIVKRVKFTKSITVSAVATCDQEIMDYVIGIDSLGVMTSDKHERCTERTAEALLKLETKYGKADIVIMVQGDEPMVEPGVLDEAIKIMTEDSALPVLNIMTSVSEADFLSKDVVKVVVNKVSEAMYFSRESIPTSRYGINETRYKQTGLILFRREALLRFNEMPATYLEKAESVDMLRILENGHRVRMLYSHAFCPSVDTPQDRDKVEEMMKEDKLFKLYSEVL